ncbi:MAG: methyltransferase domain-containing protein [Solirubrobacterales bacterium]|nr:methyltransferase domain-containing protein [Solirubrobacterales bacterium]
MESSAPLSGPAGNVYDKYASRNPIERRLVGRFLSELRSLVARSGAREAHEVGCGEGELSLMLAREGLRVRGSDVSAEVVAEAARRAEAACVEVAYREASITALDPSIDAAELLVCCEVFEHLPDPEAGLESIAALARPWLVVSVPREPLWRVLNLARGKYLDELGNTPGHLGHWSRAFLRFLRRRVDVVEARSPLPWTLALCRARR